MNLFDAGAQLGAPPLADHVIERLIRQERDLAELRHALDEVNHKVNSLLYSNANRTPESCGLFVPESAATLRGSWPSLVPTPHQLPPGPAGPSQIPVQDGPLDFEEFDMLGAYLHCVTSNP